MVKYMGFRLSVSNDLRHDADRDLRDIGAGKIDVHALNKVSIQFSREGWIMSDGFIKRTVKMSHYNCFFQWKPHCVLMTNEQKYSQRCFQKPAQSCR